LQNNCCAKKNCCGIIKEVLNGEIIVIRRLHQLQPNNQPDTLVVLTLAFGEENNEFREDNIFNN